MADRPQRTGKILILIDGCTKGGKSDVKYQKQTTDAQISRKI